MLATTDLRIPDSADSTGFIPLDRAMKVGVRPEWLETPEISSNVVPLFELASSCGPFVSVIGEKRLVYAIGHGSSNAVEEIQGATSSEAPVAVRYLRLNPRQSICKLAASTMATHTTEQPAKRILPWQSDGWDELFTDLDRWAGLEDDWDAEGGVAPAAAMLSAARSLLGRLRRAALPRPTSYIAGDGEIGFTWNRNGAYGSLALLPDGHLVGYCNPGVGRPIARVDEPYADDLSLDDLVIGLRSFA